MASPSRPPRLLREIASLPTAPFAEQRVADYLRQFVRSRKPLRLRGDRFGNLLIELPGRSPRRPRWVFTAHMDHPGFVADRMLERRRCRAVLRGWVHAEYLPGTKLRFFAGDNEITGTIESVEPERKADRGRAVRVKVSAEVPAGSFGMFDQGTGRLRGRRFLCRAIDDLGGLAAALEMLDRLSRSRSRPQSTVALLATRAEEVGFIGAVAASKDAALLRRTDRIIAIECSAMQPYAPQGKGVIIRVGDRTSIFHSALTYFLTQQAAALQKKDRGFRYQRALMPGGTCEATVYDVYGFTAAAVCLPLGNYHNMDLARRRIAPEFIDLADWHDMVKLFVRLAIEGHAFEPGHAPLRNRIEKRFADMESLL